MNVYECIAAVSADLAKEGIAKTRKNEQQGYKFRGIDEVMNALAPVLVRHKLVILPRTLSREVTERQTAKGGVLFSVVVGVEFDFVSPTDGTMHTVRTYGEAMDSADKATNKAMSAAYKYAAFQAFCIPLEGEGPDADATTPDGIVASAKPAPDVPAGYDEWLINITAAADTGYEAFKAAWAAEGSKLFRGVLVKDPGALVSLKARTEQADAKRAKVSA